MRWREKLAVIGMLALLSLPTAYTFQQQPVVAGHTTYTAMDGLDPCLAGIVGVVRLRVMWFNDQVLFERAAQDGSQFVYAIEHGAPDPRDRLLEATGEVFEFNDPNTNPWRIVEYAFEDGADVDGGNASVRGLGSQPPSPHVAGEPPDAALRRYYTWVVQTGPTARDYAATGKPYNFVNLVDTCKFQAAGSPLQHARDAEGNWTSSPDPEDPTRGAHFADDGDHGHHRFGVDLYLGDAPRAVPAEAAHDPDYAGVVT